MEAKHTNRKIPSHKTKGMLLLTVIILLDQVHFKTDSGHHSFLFFVVDIFRSEGFMNDVKCQLSETILIIPI